MLIAIIGFVLTAILLAKLRLWSRRNLPDLGWMSHQWVAAHQASQHASSM